MAARRFVDEEAAGDTAKALDSLLARLLKAGLAANLLLLVGGAMFVFFYIRERTVEWLTRDVLGDVLYVIGSSTFFLSGAVEFVIDIRWTRKFGHGRYTTNTTFNLVISILFMLGVILDLVAFVFWRQGSEGLRKEHLTQWVSSHLWLLTAILVLCTNRPQYVPFQNRMDTVANIFFLFEAVLVCCARYVSEVGDTSKNEAEIGLELGAAVLWVGNALFYIVADFVRLRNPDDILY